MQSSKRTTFNSRKLHMDINCNTEKGPISDLLSLVKQEDMEQLREALLDDIDKAYPYGEIYLYEQG